LRKAIDLFISSLIAAKTGSSFGTTVFESAGSEVSASAGSENAVVKQIEPTKIESTSAELTSALGNRSEH
jgi:hypothetical protein